MTSESRAYMGLGLALPAIARLALVVLLGGVALGLDLVSPYLRTHPIAVLFAFSVSAAFLPIRRRESLFAVGVVAFVTIAAAVLLPHYAGFWPEWAVYLVVSEALIGVAAAWRAERREMRAVLAVTEMALAYQDPDAFIRHALGRLTTAVGADYAALLLLDEDGQHLVVSRARGPEEAQVGLLRVPVGQGIAGRIAATRRPLVVPDARTLRALDPANPYLREQVRALLGVPLLVGDRLLGVLHVDATTPHRFGADDLRLLQRVGARLALALDHARLHAAERAARVQAEAGQATAEEALRQRDDFLAAVSHDLRTPLTAILGQAELLTAGLERGRDPLAQARSVAALRRATHRMHHLVEMLLDAAQVRAGETLTLAHESIDLCALVREVAELATAAAMPGSGRVHVACPEKTLFVEGDRARLERVVQNLLDNALKYSDSGQDVAVALSTETPEMVDRGEMVDTGETPDVVAGGMEQGERVVQDQEEWVVLTVRDRGVGIPPHDLPHLFTPFYRASNVRRERGGTGIGLASARRILEQHGGRIAVASDLGVGTTVIIWLPRAAPPATS